jgi:hypothetical protein
MQRQGFGGSIYDLNERVAAITDAHERLRGGVRPPAGLVFDLARAPVSPDRYEDILGVARTRREAVARGIFKTTAAPDYFDTREDGFLVARTPFAKLIENSGGSPVVPDVDAHGRDEQGQLDSAFPTVIVGELPVPGADQVYRAYEYINKLAGEGTIEVKSEGMTLADFEELAKGLQLKAAREARPGVVTDVPLGLGREVRRIADAQKKLNEHMGTDLPVTGYFNNDWLSALSNWFKSRDYREKVVRFQAEEAGFGEDIDAYLRAWRTKQGAVKDNAASMWFINAMPLPLFERGTSKTGVFVSTLDYLTHGGDAVNPMSSHFWDPTTPLHGLKRSGGLALGVVAGTVDQLKAGAAAGTAFTAELTKSVHKDDSLDRAKEKAGEVLKQHPSWLRIFAGGHLPENPEGKLAEIDQLVNVAADIILLRKPRFTGERVAPGNIKAASESTYVNVAANWAYNDLKKGRVGRAASRLEGDTGSEQLVVRAAPLVKTGQMSREQFVNHVADLYAHGRTAIVRQGGEVVEVSGPVLTSLRTDKLPTPGLPGRAWLRARDGLRKSADEIDWQLRRSPVPGSSGAANFISLIRAEFQHLAPVGPRGYFDPKLPERVHDYVVRYFGDATLANRFENALVRARATENVQGMQRIQQKLEDMYAAKYPAGRPSGNDDPFVAALGTEAPSVFRFPGGGHREIDGALGSLAHFARETNDFLVRGAMAHARLILSGFPLVFMGGGFSLFYKHMIADTLRRTAGEGGFIVGSSAAMRKAEKEIKALADGTPAISRKLGSFLARTKDSETRWLLNRGGMAEARQFRTSEKFTKRNYMEAAGGYLRRQLDDDALEAYRTVAATGSPSALVQLVLHNRTYRGMWKSARRYQEGMTAEEYAGLIFDRFNAMDEALTAAGATWDEALAVLRAHRGSKVDEALGKFIRSRGVDFEVRGGQVEMIGTFDELTGRYIERIMTFNKWNRSQFAKRVLYRSFHAFRQAGFTPDDAFETAVALAEKQTVHHMLDFANRLQIEQDLRWVSYFATKHRLYWKWVLGTVVRNPGYAAAISDFDDLLNERGSIEFSVGGLKLAIPAHRLVWVPGAEYSEFSPLALAVAGFVKGGPAGAVEASKGTFGNVVTRNDTALHYAIKLTRMATGNQPTTYGAALEGLDDRSRAMLDFRINSFQNDYFREHGHYAPEAVAVKHALWRTLANELWRANMPLPVVPATGENDGQKLLREFMQINDPAKRRKFLDDNPELSLYFGIYTDPKEYLHTRKMWGRYIAASEARDVVRARIYAESRSEGAFTPDMRRQLREADERFGKVFDALLLEDAKTGGGTVRQGKVVTPGPWGKQVATDPLIDPRGAIKRLFPNVPDEAIEEGVPGELVKELRAELRRLNDPKFASTYEDPAELKARRREILEQIAVFSSYPKDAIGRVERKYQAEYVNPFWAARDRRYEHIRNELPSAEQELAWAEFRQWRDEQDKPVVIDGIKFPSPIRMAWAMLDPATRRDRLARLAAASWAHLTDYEKELLLEQKPPPKMSEGWAQLERAKAAYREQNPGASIDRQQTLAVVKQVEKLYPGFFRDWQMSQRPKIRRFEATTLYRSLPGRVEFDRVIGASAKKIAGALATGDYSSAELTAHWRKFVKEQVQPWLQRPENTRLRLALEPYGPDFLNTLVRP